MFTNRQGSGYHNRVVNVDLNYRLSDADTIQANIAGSQTRYNDTIANELQLSTEDLNDRAIMAQYRHSERNWWAQARYRDLGEDFRADLGFVPQVNLRMYLAGGGYRWWGEEGQWFNRLSIGGDYAITRPILKAIAGREARISGGRKAALLHFDAHRDDYQHIPHWLGSVRSAAHWAAYTVVEEHVDPARSVQLGMRGNPIKPRADITESKLGYRLVPADEFYRTGIEETVAIIRERVGDAPLYITFDLDVLDPTEAPAVANLEPGHRGLRAWEVIEIFHGLRGLDVIGADIVCMIPSKDTAAKITAMTAMVLMFEMIALIGDRLANGASGAAD